LVAVPLSSALGPKIEPSDSELVKKVGDNFMLTCKSDKKIEWIFPVNLTVSEFFHSNLYLFKNYFSLPIRRAT
jgi:hypothetical protein